MKGGRCSHDGGGCSCIPCRSKTRRTPWWRQPTQWQRRPASGSQVGEGEASVERECGCAWHVGLDEATLNLVSWLAQVEDVKDAIAAALARASDQSGGFLWLGGPWTVPTGPVDAGGSAYS